MLTVDSTSSLHTGTIVGEEVINLGTIDFGADLDIRNCASF